MQSQNDKEKLKNILQVPSDSEGQRVDNFLLKSLKNLTKSNIYKLLRKGQIRVNGKRTKPTQRLQQNDKIRIPPFLIEDDKQDVYISDKILNQIRSSIVFENPNYLIVNKPSGMPVHAGTGIRFGLIDVCQRLFPNANLQLAHRLDRDTSGCVVMAKSRLALNQFNQQNPKKFYLALVKGKLNDDTIIDLKLDTNHRENGEKTVIVSDSGKSAKTFFRVSERFWKPSATPNSSTNPDATLLHCELLTGRTHQIRVHAAASDFPLAGDPKYGDKKFNKHLQTLGLKRLFLHASSIEFEDNEDSIIASSELPDDLQNLLNNL